MSRHHRKAYPQIAAAIALATCLTALPAMAEVLVYSANLTGEAGRPPVETDATGLADIAVDTEAQTVTWTITLGGLSGKVVAGHFHGPAGPDETAPPVIDLDTRLDTRAQGTTAGPEALEDGATAPAAGLGATDDIAAATMAGTAPLTDGQLADLLAGRYYLNIHTEQHPAGEIRGQVVKGPAPSGQSGANPPAQGATGAVAMADLAAGEKIFRSSCRSCHGPKARGMASFPKLAGRDAGYLEDRLHTYRDGQTIGPNSRLMIPVAQKLSDEEIADVAAFIATRFR